MNDIDFESKFQNQIKNDEDLDSLEKFDNEGDSSKKIFAILFSKLAKRTTYMNILKLCIKLLGIDHFFNLVAT